MITPVLHRIKRWLSLRSLLAAFIAAAVIAAPAAASLPATSGHDEQKPTLVFVHGAFADSSGWAEVAGRYLDAGYPVHAVSNPLRGIQYDSAYLKSYLATIKGPVVLIGHSYGGAVITNAATGNPNVEALVYIAAYALDGKETVQAANTLGGGQTEVTNHLVIRPFPGAQEGDADAYIDPAHFARLFAQDLPKQVTDFMGVSQRPGALASLVTPSGAPAWKEIPSWYMVARNDNIIPPEAQRVMADRAGATTVEVKSSHVPMMSRPSKVVDLIDRAIDGTH
ncbi:alpha/beta fold hydrolase [Arthrobacter zhaoguopingii]|uniref:alpha/beta fold hydrolase n=1 Tax=Arthrobacter zhaoguopingii TaxID=2681491 RepID=UPI00135ACFBA|nr:alpha/beta hydrolase [Arthrobacter zhaoguopingii]